MSSKCWSWIIKRHKGREVQRYVRYDKRDYTIASMRELRAATNSNAFMRMLTDHRNPFDGFMGDVNDMLFFHDDEQLKRLKKHFITIFNYI